MCAFYHEYLSGRCIFKTSCGSEDFSREFAFVIRGYYSAHIVTRRYCIYGLDGGVLAYALLPLIPLRDPPLFFLKKRKKQADKGTNRRSYRSLRTSPLAKSTLRHLHLLRWVWLCRHSEQPGISDRCILSNGVPSQGKCRNESLLDLPEFLCQ